MHVVQRIRSISPAPMGEIDARVPALKRQGAPVISLGQGVPGFPPPTGALDSAMNCLFASSKPCVCTARCLSRP